MLMQHVGLADIHLILIAQACKSMPSRGLQQSLFLCMYSLSSTNSTFLLHCLFQPECICMTLLHQDKVTAAIICKQANRTKQQKHLSVTAEHKLRITNRTCCQLWPVITTSWIVWTRCHALPCVHHLSASFCLTAFEL